MSDPRPQSGEEPQNLTATTIQATPLPFRSEGAGGEVAPTYRISGEEEGIRFILIIEREMEIQAYPLRQVIHTIGRSVDNSIRIQDRYLSRHHAYLVRVPSGVSYTYSVFDGDREQSLPSRNGVFVNDQRVKSHSLRMGDVVYLGPNVRMALHSVALPENSDRTAERVPAEMSR